MIRPHARVASVSDSRVGTELPASVDPDSRQRIRQSAQFRVFLGVLVLGQNGLSHVEGFPSKLSAPPVLHVQHWAAILVAEVKEGFDLAGGLLGILQPLVEHDERVALRSEDQPIPDSWILMESGYSALGEHQLDTGGWKARAGTGSRARWIALP